MEVSKTYLGVRGCWAVGSHFDPGPSLVDDMPCGSRTLLLARCLAWSAAGCGRTRYRAGDAGLDAAEVDGVMTTTPPSDVGNFEWVAIGVATQRDMIDAYYDDVVVSTAPVPCLPM